MTNGLPELRVLPDGGAVAEAAAIEIVRVLAGAIAARGRADWATTGGSVAPPIYRRLAGAPLREVVDWSRVHTWWGDDRFVPFDHELSNVRPFEEILLGAGSTDPGSVGVRMPAANIHRFPIPEALAGGHDPAWCAARYEEELREHGPPPDADGTPVLDLVVLGVGPDGHILSVFPGSGVWDAGDLCTAVPAPTHIEPQVERVTMHPRLVRAARAVLVVSTGPAKAAACSNAWGGGDARALPVRAARRAGATWILDAAAAADLPTG